MKIAVAMSGGVDSSVAAALVKGMGHEALGVTMRLWGTDADSEPSVSSAREVCRVLGIPHRTADLRLPFREEIIEYFTGEYVAGLTPNPCVRCNRSIKFGELGKLARDLGAQRLATGHYARIQSDDSTGRYNLLRALDPAKDQSYFLHRLTQDQMALAMFPLGGMKKSEVRKLAARLGLPTAERDESQEVCFIPDDDYRRFVELERPDSARYGEFVDRAGNSLGRHRGVAFYTIGQRKGLGVSSPLGRRYVLERDPATNRIVLGGEAELMKEGCLVGEVNWVGIDAPQGPFEADVMLRSRFTPVQARVLPAGEVVRVMFSRPVSGVSPGQSAVFYRGDTVLGGGVIRREPVG